MGDASMIEKRKCVVCGKKVLGTAGRKYCSAACRQKAYLARRDKKEADQVAAMIEKMSTIAPVTASKLDAFSREHGKDCTQAAVRLVMQGIAEFGGFSPSAAV